MPRNSNESCQNCVDGVRLQMTLLISSVFSKGAWHQALTHCSGLVTKYLYGCRLLIKYTLAVQNERRCTN